MQPVQISSFFIHGIIIMTKPFYTVLIASIIFMACAGSVLGGVEDLACFYLDFENDNGAYGGYSDNPAFYNKAITPAASPDYVGSNEATYPKISTEGVKGSCWEASESFPAGGATVTYNWKIPPSVNALSNARSYTISGWLNTKDATKAGGNSYILHGFGTGVAIKWLGDGRLQFLDNGTWYYSSWSTFNSYGNWVFFAITRKSDSVAFYKADENNSVTLVNETTGLSLPFTSAETNMVLGGWTYNGSDLYTFFDLDEFRIFSSTDEDTAALSIEELSQLRDHDLTPAEEEEDLGPCSDPNGAFIIGDTNYDCIVDFNDLLNVAQSWLSYPEEKAYQLGDINLDDTVDFKDFSMVASNWQGRPAVVSNVDAFYRDGQVFITWDEAAYNTEDMRVYISAESIDGTNLCDAVLLTDKLEAHSGNDWFDDPALCPKATGPRHGWVIEAGSEPLDADSGLFVHTVTGIDPGSAYFAVLPGSYDANSLVAGNNATTAGVAVQVATPQPIYQLAGTEISSGGLPLALYLHSHTSRPAGALTHLMFGDGSMGWREGLPTKFKVSVLSNVVLVEPYDRVWINRKLSGTETYEAYNTTYKNIESWWYGTNDKIYDGELRLTGTPTNYMERILLFMMDAVEGIYETDVNRVYAFGASMGTGVQRLVMENPDRFASVDVLVPFVDFAYEDGVESNAKRFGACCGDVNLICSDGMTLAERFDLVDFVGNTASDLPPVIIRIGRQDNSVYWQRKPAYISAMQQQRHELIAGWDNGTHSTAMRYAVSAFPSFRNYSWHIQRLALDLSYPAFTNFSLNENPGNGQRTDGDIVGFINRGLDWDGIIDTPGRYEIHISCTHPDAVYPVSTDITIRRRQDFVPGNGVNIAATNLDGNSQVIGSKNVTVDSAGRITFEDFSITSAGGNTLVFEVSP
jgi:hypothetical protein